MIPKPLSNPAAALIRDTIAHHGITQAEAAEAMKVSRAQLSDFSRQKKAVSANLALRAQFCIGLLGDLLIRLQAQFDCQNKTKEFTLLGMFFLCGGKDLICCSASVR